MDEHALWRRLRRHIESGRESAKVDLKLTLDLGPRDKRGEFAKDVTAIANTPGGDGFIVIGVVDAKDRYSNDPLNYDDYIEEGFSVADPDAFQRQMVEALSRFCDPRPEVEYYQLTHPQCGKPLGVVHVPRSFKRPHRITRDSGTTRVYQTWVRRGTASFSASAGEVTPMPDDQPERPACMVINLSLRPLTPDQLQEIEQQSYIEELIEFPVQFKSSEPAFEQVVDLVERIGLSADEWPTKPILLGLPGLSPVAAATLAYLHGVMGHFPKILWLRPNPQDGSQYQVRDLVQLQDFRDRGQELPATARRQV